jgi:hypothetical protein
MSVQQTNLFWALSLDLILKLFVKMRLAISFACVQIS